MHIAINATTIRPGGGLTVIRGLVHSLREVAPDWRLTVLTNDSRTHQAIEDDGRADRVEQILPGAKASRLFLWQNFGFGKWARTCRADIVITVNHYAANIPCPQIVYHLNLLRFRKPSPTPIGFGAIPEMLRDWSAFRALKQADANIFESRFLQDAAESAFGRPVRNPSVIYIGLPERLISLSEKKIVSLPNSHRIVSITSPAAHKDNPTLVRMLADLTSDNPSTDWHLDIAGGTNPQEWGPTKELARQLNVFDRITWHGFCDQDRLTALLNGACCLVSTSIVESFAMVALEAMARGCPPIVSNCASMPESIGNAGLLAEPGNHKSFSAAVKQIAENSELRQVLVNNGYEWMRQFQWAACGRSFARLIEQQISMNPSDRNSSQMKRVG